MGADLFVFREQWDFPVKACSLLSQALLTWSLETRVITLWPQRLGVSHNSSQVPGQPQCAGISWARGSPATMILISWVFQLLPRFLYAGNEGCAAHPRELMVASGRSVLAHSWGLQPTEQTGSRDLTSALHPTTTSSQCWRPRGSAEDSFIVPPELIALLSNPSVD